MQSWLNSSYVYSQIKLDSDQNLISNIFSLFYKEERQTTIYRVVIFFGWFAASLTFNNTPQLAKRNETRLCCRSMHRMYSVANDHRRDGDKQRYRWKRGNWTAAVVLTNDLTPVWTVAFDEIRIISVGACQCKCHTYIQLPLVTLRSTAGHGKPGTPLFHRVSFLCPRTRIRESLVLQPSPTMSLQNDLR